MYRYPPTRLRVGIRFARAEPSRLSKVLVKDCIHNASYAVIQKVGGAQADSEGAIVEPAQNDETSLWLYFAYVEGYRRGICASSTLALSRSLGN